MQQARLIQQLEQLDFIEKEIPTGNDWSLANRTCASFFVEKQRDSLIVTEKEDIFHTHTISTDQIDYIGTDRGEWGGELTANFSNGRSQVLIRDNIVQLEPHRESLYVFTGLSHLGLCTGAIYEIEHYESVPKAKRLMLLPDTPVVVIKQGEDKKVANYLIAGTSSLMFVSGNHLEVILSSQFWDGLYPTSVVQWSQDILIVGIRSGIVLITGEGSHRIVRYFSKENLQRFL